MAAICLGLNVLSHQYDAVMFLDNTDTAESVCQM